MSAISEAVPTSGRDLRVDFFRGLALWVIFWDHGLILGRVEFAPFYCMPAFTMFSDAAELFVFLSGFVFGLVYMKVLVREGMKACYLKALQRVWQIYRAHALTFLAAFAVAYGFFLRYGFVLLEMDTLIAEPEKLVPLGLVLYYLPLAFDILPLYIVLLAVMPALLGIYRSRPRLAIGLSVALYLFAQVMPEINVPRYAPAFASSGQWFFNVFAWQLIFFIGMALGARKRLGGNIRVPRHKALIIAAAVFLVVSPALRIGGFLVYLEWGEVKAVLESGDLHGQMDELVGLTEEDIYAGVLPEIGFPLTDKRTLEPVRLLHFFAAVYLVVALLRSDLRFWRSRWAKPLLLCGRHSLEIFCLSIAGNYCIGLLLQVYGGGPAAFALYSVLGFLALSWIAWALERRKDEGKQRVTAGEPAVGKVP